MTNTKKNSEEAYTVGDFARLGAAVRDARKRLGFDFKGFYNNFDIGTDAVLFEGGSSLINPTQIISCLARMEKWLGWPKGAATEILQGSQAVPTGSDTDGPWIGLPTAESVTETSAIKDQMALRQERDTQLLASYRQSCQFLTLLQSDYGVSGDVMGAAMVSLNQVFTQAVRNNV